MKKVLMITGLAFTLMNFISAQSGTATLTEVGQEAPAFTCTTVDGTVIDSHEMRGRVIWINFFATWCPPCKKELPVLQEKIMEKYGENPDFVLVVLGREHSMEEMKEFAASTGLQLPFAPDPERGIFSLYAESTIPRNVIIDRDGKISYQSIGYTEEEFSKLGDHLKSLLN